MRTPIDTPAGKTLCRGCLEPMSHMTQANQLALCNECKDTIKELPIDRRAAAIGEILRSKHSEDMTSAIVGMLAIVQRAETRLPNPPSDN